MGLRRREWLAVMLRLLTLTPVNGQNRGLNEIDFTTIGGEAKATSTAPFDSCKPIEAFLKTGGLWCDNQEPLPQIIWYEFQKAIIVTKFSFQGRLSVSEWKTDSPSKYQFFGSNFVDQCDDETHWNVLLEDLSGTLLTSEDDIKVEEICNPSKYICYGFKVLETQKKEKVRMRNIRFYASSQSNYTPKKLFQVSYPDVTAPIRRGAPNCPANNIPGCFGSDDYLEIYSEQSLVDTKVDSIYTFTRKSCECKCLCLDDPLCQAVTILSPKTKMDAHRCLFNRNNAVQDETILHSQLRATSYIKRGCNRVNCTLNSICDDSDGTKAAVCGCEDTYELTGLKCSKN